jgi:hypothetical protein
VDGAGEAWNVGPAYAVAVGVDIGLAEVCEIPACEPVNGGVLRAFLGTAGDVVTLLGLPLPFDLGLGRLSDVVI